MATEEFYLRPKPAGDKKTLSILGGEEFQITAENYADLELGTCWSLGPLSICVRQDGQKIRLCFKVLGTELGCATIVETKPCVGWKGGIGPVNVEVKVCADFEKRQIIAEGEICTLICIDFRKVIFNW